MDKAIISELSEETLRLLAVYYARTARRMKMRAAELSVWKDQRQRAFDHRHELEEATLLVPKYISMGMTYDAAIRAAAQTSGMETWCLEGRFKRLCLERESAGRDARQVAVMRLARSGFSNKEIAERIGCHRNTVSRDIGKALGRD
jgi:DNA-directed RNA polymerase specialized sigma24 family protein